MSSRFISVPRGVGNIPCDSCLKESSVRLESKFSSRLLKNSWNQPQTNKLAVAISCSGSSGDFVPQGPPPKKRTVRKANLKDLGYHPLEDITLKKDSDPLPFEGKLSAADMARTVAEVCEECIVFASVIQDDNSVVGVNADFMVHHSGEIFLELDDSLDFIQNLQSDQTCSILIGYGDIEDISVSDFLEDSDEKSQEQSEALPEDLQEEADNVARPLTEDEIEMFKAQFGEDWQQILESMSPEGMGSLGAWGGPDSLKWVHPWDFALKLLESVVSDPSAAMDFPVRRLSITGVVRKATDDEELRIRDLWNEKYADSDDELEEARREQGAASVLSAELDGEAQLEEQLASSSAGRDGSVLFAGRVMVGPGSVRFLHVAGLSEFLPLSSDGMAEEDAHSLLANFGLVESLGSFPEGAQVVHVEAVLAEDGSISWSVTDMDGSPTALDDPASLEALQAFLENESSEGGVVNFSIGAEGLRLGLGGPQEDDDSDSERDGAAGEAGLEDSPSTSLYKVEIMSVQLDSTNGWQEAVDVAHWMAARPDMLAHASSAIIARANSLERARRCMADLVLREHGIAADDVFMNGIDHLGIDIRIRTGIEMRTLRFPFIHPASSERAAEKLLDELLRPKQGKVRRTSKRHRQPKRVRGRLNRP